MKSVLSHNEGHYIRIRSYDVMIIKKTRTTSSMAE